MERNNAEDREGKEEERKTERERALMKKKEQTK
jgi:hypothetical protein